MKKIFIFVLLVFVGCKPTKELQYKISFNLPDEYCNNLGLFSDLSKYLSNPTVKGFFFGKNVFFENEKYSYKPNTNKTTYKNPIYFKYLNSKNKEIVLVDSVNVHQNFQYINPYISQVVNFDDLNKFFEIKNTNWYLDNYTGYFYLALYLNGKSETEKPDSYIDIGHIEKNAVKVFRGLNTKYPKYALEKGIIWNGIDEYDGINDKIILTTSFDNTAYKNKIDEFDLEFSENTEASYVKTSCDKLCQQNQEVKSLNWIYFTKDEVCKENSLTNAEIGRHYDGILTFQPDILNIPYGYWNESSISNIRKTPIHESMPDRSRNLSLQTDYNSEIFGEFEAFSLDLGHFTELTLGENHVIKILNDFNTSETSNIILKKNAKFEYQSK